MGTITRTFTNNIGSNGVLGLSAINNASLNNITSITGVSLKLLSTATASGDASLSFTSGIDSTYDEYWFVFNNMHPSVNTGGLYVNFSTDGGSNYNETKTTSVINAQHSEDNGIALISYETPADLAQSTADQRLCYNVYTGNDECMGGILKLYNPSSTTYVKHFMSTTQNYFASTRSMQFLVSGYCNTTSPVDGVIFRFNTGNIDDGT